MLSICLLLALVFSIPFLREAGRISACQGCPPTGLGVVGRILAEAALFVSVALGCMGLVLRRSSIPFWLPALVLVLPVTSVADSGITAVFVEGPFMMRQWVPWIDAASPPAWSDSRALGAAIVAILIVAPALTVWLADRRKASAQGRAVMRRSTLIVAGALVVTYGTGVLFAWILTIAFGLPWNGAHEAAGIMAGALVASLLIVAGLQMEGIRAVLAVAALTCLASGWFAAALAPRWQLGDSPISPFSLAGAASWLIPFAVAVAALALLGLWRTALRRPNQRE